MAKSKSSRRNRKGRKLDPKPAPVGAQTRRVVAQPVAVAVPGEAPTIAVKPKAGIRGTGATRRDYSYVRRDLKRIAILASAVLITIVVVSFFLP